VRVLLWPVHGGYTDAFVRGDHEYLLPIEAGADAEDPSLSAWGWVNTRQVPQDRLRDELIDIVVLQRLEELDECARLTGRVPGRDVPAVFLEHNTPQPEAVARVHPLADRTDIPIVHVTHFNQLVWDCGRAATTVVEHGVPDPGALYSGELPRIGVVVNEPVRRWRVVGTDLLPEFGREAPVDVFGMGGEQLSRAFQGTSAVVPAGDLPPDQLHRELARRRVYLHPFRWTSLGLSLLEAMHLAMPVVALATTEVVRAVPPGTGVISTNVGDLHAAVRAFLADPAWAREVGRAGRAHALARYGLPAFLARWDDVLSEVVDEHGGHVDWPARVAG
jgi:glycosyltransferase involved in cell wall biosynthesis